MGLRGIARKTKSQSQINFLLSVNATLFRQFNQLVLNGNRFFVLKSTWSLFRHAGLRYEQEELRLKILFHIFMQSWHMTAFSSLLRWIRKTNARICAALLHFLFFFYLVRHTAAARPCVACRTSQFHLYVTPRYLSLVWTVILLVLDLWINHELSLKWDSPQMNSEVWVGFQLQPRNVSVDLQIIPLLLTFTELNLL